MHTPQHSDSGIAIEFQGWRVPTGFKSDGCTLAPDSYLAIRWRPFELYRLSLKPACKLHDFNRRHRVHYGVMSAEQADHVFRAHLRALGASPLLAGLYYGFVKVTRSKYKRTLPLPPGSGWHQYLKRVPEGG